jgi:predicted transcriptional regulator
MSWEVIRVFSQKSALAGRLSMICSLSDLAEPVMKNTAKPTLAEQRAQYEAWYAEQVRLGLEDIQAGRVVSDEEVTKHMQRLREELRATSGQVARAA